MATYRKPSQRKTKRKQNPSLSWAEGGILFLLGITVFSFWFAYGNNPFKINIQTLTQPYILGEPEEDFLSQNAEQPIKIGSSERLQNIDFSAIDYAAATLEYNGNSVDELAEILSGYAQTDTEKARIIYSWITKHIDYDTEAFFNNQFQFLKPEEILTQRKGICSGYAILFRALAKAMGLDAVAVTGYAKGDGYLVGDDTRENHAWNAVKIDGYWYLMDPTWGAGIIENRSFVKQFNAYYFAPPPKQFIYDHFPSRIEWQLLAQPFSRETFNQLPNVSSTFFTNEIKLGNYPTNTINSRGKVEIILEVPDDVLVTAKLKQNGKVLEDSYTFTQKVNGQAVVSVGFPESGKYELDIYSARKDNSEVYHRSLSYNINTANSAPQFPETYSNFRLNDVYLSSPITKSLTPNQYIYFQIKVPEAVDVVVIDGDNKWTKLEQNGITFQGAVQVTGGKVKLSAKFPGDERYWGLVEYN